METAFYQNAEDRSKWQVFSDDPYWQRKLEKAGAVLVKAGGDGKTYTLRQDQVLIRVGKRAVSKAQRDSAAIRMRNMRKPIPDIEKGG